MATFAELVADVKIITNRPDMDSQIKHAVKVATLKAHQSDYYYKDLFETAITFDTAAFTQSIDYRSIIPRWRSLKYLRKYANSLPGAFFSILTPEQTLDGYGSLKDDICYVAGEQIEVRSSTEDDYMLLGCYLNPMLTEEGYNSWIAKDHPYVIEYDAAARIFRQIGFDEQAAAMRQEILEQLTELRASNIQAQGY